MPTQMPSTYYDCDKDNSHSEHNYHGNRLILRDKIIKCVLAASEWSSREAFLLTLQFSKVKIQHKQSKIYKQILHCSQIKY